MDKPEPIRPIKRGGFGWRLAGNASAALLECVLQATSTPNDARAEIVKRNPTRIVLRIKHDGKPFYAKWHRFRGVPDALLSFFRGTRAAREWENLRLLQRQGIPVVAPVALGVKRRWGFPVESILITAGIDGKDLRQVAKEVRHGARRRALATAAGRFIHTLHDAGLDCPDLHGENLLVRTDDSSLCLLDLHAAIQGGGAVGEEARLQNLAFLCNSMADGRSSAAGQVRFLRAYLGAGSSGPALRQAMHSISVYKARLHHRHIHSRSRRCMKHSSEFTHERTAFGIVYRQRIMRPEQVARAIELHHDVLAGKACGEAVKRHLKTNVTIINWDGSLNADTLCVKEFVRPAICRLFPKRLRHRNAVAGWRAALGLRVRGIAAPEALTVVLGRGLHSYLIMRTVNGTERLADYVSRALGADVSAPRRRAFLHAAAEALCEVFAAGVAHADMKATNVLVREAEAGDGWQFILLDLDAVRFRNLLKLKEKVLNLAQLNAALPLALTWADRLHFLRLLAQREAALGTRKTMADIGRATLERTCVWG